MTNVIDNAVARLQDISQAMTSVTIKSAPDYAIENADPLPMSVAYLASGSFQAMNATTTIFLPVINVEFHFSRQNLKQAYKDIYAVALEFSQRLHGDVTLNGYVDTIFTSDNQSIPYTVRPYSWGKPTNTAPEFFTQMLLFEIPFKYITTPTSTP